MPSIREELRVSEKLASDIVGPSLATATAILDNAYAIRAKAAQEVQFTITRTDAIDGGHQSEFYSSSCTCHVMIVCLSSHVP